MDPGRKIISWSSDVNARLFEFIVRYSKTEDALTLSVKTKSPIFPNTLIDQERQKLLVEFDKAIRFMDGYSPHAYLINELRIVYPNAYSPWKPEDDSKLAESFHQGRSISALCNEFERKPGGIVSRLKKLGLTPK